MCIIEILILKEKLCFVEATRIIFLQPMIIGLVFKRSQIEAVHLDCILRLTKIEKK